MKQSAIALSLYVGSGQGDSSAMQHSPATSMVGFWSLLESSDPSGEPKLKTAKTFEANPSKQRGLFIFTMSGADETGAQGGALLLNQPVIFDNGSSTIKAGFAGSSKPKVRRRPAILDEYRSGPNPDTVERTCFANVLSTYSSPTCYLSTRLS